MRGFRAAAAALSLSLAIAGPVWAQAADWFLCGTHHALSSMARAGHAKCLRKAALSQIQGGEYAAASATLRRCPGDEAATHYVVMLAAVHQGTVMSALNASCVALTLRQGLKMKVRIPVVGSIAVD